MSHTTSRVLQAAVKAAGADARAAVLAEVAPDALPLAKSSYGHFLLTKLISLAPKEEVPGEMSLVRAPVTVGSVPPTERSWWIE